MRLTLAQYVPLFAVLAVLGAINGFYCQVLAGFKDIAKRTVITNFVGSPLVIALTVVLLALGTGMWGYLGAQIISATIVTVLLVAAAWRLTPPAGAVFAGGSASARPRSQVSGPGFPGDECSRFSGDAGRQDSARDCI